jgi:hypothetical protein
MTSHHNSLVPSAGRRLAGAEQPGGRRGLIAGPADAAALVVLHRQLHAAGVHLLTGGADDATRWIIDILDTATPLVPVLTRISPAVRDTLGNLHTHTRLSVLCSELTEAHRLLGHALRDRDIDPGRPDTPVGDVLRDAFPTTP